MRFEIALSKLFILFLPLGITGAQSADYYVSTQGNDSNPGTSSQPFRTITRAYSQAAPGVTIVVMPGVYTDYTRNWGLRLNANGTASNPIILRSQVRGGAVIDGQNGADRNKAIYLDGSYNIIDGFQIRGGPNGGITIWGSDNQILNNEIHHNGNSPSTSNYGRDGIYSDKGTRNNVYRGNNIHDNGRTGTNYKLDHGLYLCGDNELVANNCSVRNSGSGIQVAGYSTVQNMRIYNNVVAHNGTQGIILWLDLDGLDIKNNILYGNTSYGIYSYDAHGRGVSIDRNLVFENGLGHYTLANGGSDFAHTLGSTVSADPRFVNSSRDNLDVHLAAGSPAITAGHNLYSTFTVDMDGAARQATGPWDLGVFSSGASTAPNPPSGLSFSADSGSITGPFVAGGGAIWQTDYTGVTQGGRAVYTFNVPTTGDYWISALVNAPDESANSLFVNIDAEPQDPTMIWDVPVTSGFSKQAVSWRGSGTAEANEFAPKVFRLTAGTHHLIVRGREGNCQLGALTITPSAPPSGGDTTPTTVPISSIRFTASGAQVTWATSSGKTYRVARKRHLNEAAWTTISGALSASGTSRSWTDQNAGKEGYYVVQEIE